MESRDQAINRLSMWLKLEAIANFSPMLNIMWERMLLFKSVSRSLGCLAGSTSMAIMMMMMMRRIMTTTILFQADRQCTMNCNISWQIKHLRDVSGI